VPAARRLAAAGALLGALSPAVAAQAYSTSVVVRNLMRPTGIVVGSDQTLWVTEVPEPGRGNGNNKVARIEPDFTTKTVLAMGEPEPTHIARSASGDLYWTCTSAGVIQHRSGSMQTTLLRMLEKPSGIAIGGNGVLYFTEVPTPGVNGMNGGRNKVSSWTQSGGVQTVTMGEPEPRDIAVDGHHNVFWTCRSANVILWRDARTSVVAPLLTGLDKPSGIAVDAHGAIYFSEVPTPGMSAAQGGRNRVSRYVPATRTLTVIDFGDPEPFDVAVTPDGSNVFWTCSSAGVIVRAQSVRRPVTLTAAGALMPGRPLPLLLSASGFGGKMYVAGTSLGLGPIRVGGEYLALAPDPLLMLTIGGGTPSVFGGYFGVLDVFGRASAAIALPEVAGGLRGVVLFTAYVVLDPQLPLGFAATSETLRLVVD
jgi:streptogramin lyase